MLAHLKSVRITMIPGFPWQSIHEDDGAILRWFLPWSNSAPQVHGSLGSRGKIRKKTVQERRGSAQVWALRREGFQKKGCYLWVWMSHQGNLKRSRPGLKIKAPLVSNEILPEMYIRCHCNVALTQIFQKQITSTFSVWNCKISLLEIQWASKKFDKIWWLMMMVLVHCLY